MPRKLALVALLASGLAISSASADPLGAVSISASAPAQVGCTDIFEDDVKTGTAFGVFEVTGSSSLLDTLPFPRQAVRIDVDGVDVAVGETDMDGNFTATVQGILPGLHEVVATVSPSTPLATSSATLQVEVTGVISYADADGDGYGDGSTVDCTETVAPGRVTVEGDCDDSNANVNPGEEEVPGNEIDDDCNEFTSDNN